MQPDKKGLTELIEECQKIALLIDVEQIARINSHNPLELALLASTLLKIVVLSSVNDNNLLALQAFSIYNSKIKPLFEKEIVNTTDDKEKDSHSIPLLSLLKTPLIFSFVETFIEKRARLSEEI